MIQQSVNDALLAVLNRWKNPAIGWERDAVPEGANWQKEGNQIRAGSFPGIMINELPTSGHFR